MRTALIIACLGSIAVGLGVASHSSSDEAIEEIIAAVSAARESIHEFDAKYTFRRIKGGGNAVDRETHHFRYLNGMVHLNRAYSFPDGDAVWEWDFGFDGDVLWSKPKARSSMSIGTHASADQIGLDTETGAFTNLMLWFPCHEARYGELHLRDLLSMLASDDAVVRPEKEWVGDAHCVVVEFGDAYGKDFTVWLDPERGYLPVLQRSFGAIDYELRIDEAAEVAPGVWMPMVGTRLVGAHPDVPELPVPSEFRMEVEFVSVNAGVLQPSDFEYMNWVVPGTTVIDHDTGETWIASARDYSEATDVVLARATVPIDKLDDDGGTSLSLTAAPWRNAWWLALIIGCALTSCWLVLKGRR
jgi:hypothetical protein